MATYYVDSVNGLNSNPGTQAQPFQTWGKGVSSLADGDTLRLKRDCCFGPGGGFYASVSQLDGITITDYGTGGLPVLDSLTYENSDATGWTHEGAGVWSKLFGNGANGNSRTKRLWVGASNSGNLRTQRVVGTAMRRAKAPEADTLADITANLNADDIWRPSQGALGYKLYVYTGSTTVNPPSFYSGLALLVGDQATIGAYPAVLLRACSNVLVENIESWGSSSTAFVVQSNVADTLLTENIVIRNCAAKYFYTGAFKAAPATENSTAPKVPVKNILITGCLADLGTSAQEQEPDNTYNYLINAPDAFSFTDLAINCRAEYCTSINSMHVAYTMGSYADNRYKPDNCGFYRCKAFWDTWHTYGRAVTTYPTEPSCYVIECDFDGQTVRSQINGAPYIYRNVWRNMRVTNTRVGVSQAINITAELLYRSNVPALGNDAYIINVPTGVRIYENMFVDPMGPVLALTSFTPVGTKPVPEPVIEAKTVEFSNNICYHRGADVPWYQVEMFGETIGVQTVQNNNVFTGTNPAPRAWVDGTTFALNAAPGCAANISADPLVDMSNPTKLTLSLASPCRGSGKFSKAPFDKRRYKKPDIGPFGKSLTRTLL